MTIEKDVLPHYIGKKELTKIIERLQEVRRASTMERMSVRNILVRPSTAATFEDGRPVTEGTVDEFIRERLRLYNGTWITGILEDIIDQMVVSIYGGGKWRGRDRVTARAVKDLVSP